MIGNAVITTEDFQNEAARRSTILTREKGKELMKEMVRTEALYARAKSAGYDRDPALLARFKRMVAAQFEEDELKRSERLAAPTSGELEQYYQDHASRYSIPGKARPALIFVKIPGKATAEKRRALREKAESILAEAQTNSTAFSDLARANSDDPATQL